MNRFLVNIRRLALLLLPTFLRRPKIVALLYSIVTPLCYVYSRFMTFRQQSNYKLIYNGQVCYLRGILNNMFDEGHRRIVVRDAKATSGLTVPMRAITSIDCIVPMRKYSANSNMVVSKRGFGGMHGYDFYVDIPMAVLEKQDVNNDRIKAIINMYKLASKRYVINYTI